MANKTPKASAKPVASYRYGSVSAAVFTNQVKNKAGETFDAYSVSLRRSYRNAKGDWSQTNSLHPADLASARLALQECHEFIQNARGVRSN